MCVTALASPVVCVIAVHLWPCVVAVASLVVILEGDLLLLPINDPSRKPIWRIAGNSICLSLIPHHGEQGNSADPYRVVSIR